MALNRFDGRKHRQSRKYTELNVLNPIICPTYSDQVPLALKMDALLFLEWAYCAILECLRFRRCFIV